MDSADDDISPLHDILIYIIKHVLVYDHDIKLNI